MFLQNLRDVDHDVRRITMVRFLQVGNVFSWTATSPTWNANRKIVASDIESMLLQLIFNHKKNVILSPYHLPPPTRASSSPQAEPLPKPPHPMTPCNKNSPSGYHIPHQNWHGDELAQSIAQLTTRLHYLVTQKYLCPQNVVVSKVPISPKIPLPFRSRTIFFG